MNRRFVVAGTCGAALLAMEVAGIAFSEPATTDVRPSRNQPVVAAQAPGALARDPAGDRTGAWAAHILARPLFSPSRKPAALEAAAPMAAAGRRSDPPRLTGAAFWPHGGAAIFATDAGASVTIPEGGSLDGWWVLHIGADGVVVGDGVEQWVLHPQFAQAAEAADGDAAPVAVAAGEIQISETPAERTAGAATRIRDTAGRHVPPPSYLERIR